MTTCLQLVIDISNIYVKFRFRISNHFQVMRNNVENTQTENLAFQIHVYMVFYDCLNPKNKYTLCVHQIYIHPVLYQSCCFSYNFIVIYHFVLYFFSPGVQLSLWSITRFVSWIILVLGLVDPPQQSTSLVQTTMSYFCTGEFLYTSQM